MLYAHNAKTNDSWNTKKKKVILNQIQTQKEKKKNGWVEKNTIINIKSKVTSSTHSMSNKTYLFNQTAWHKRKYRGMFYGKRCFTMIKSHWQWERETRRCYRHEWLNSSSQVRSVSNFGCRLFVMFAILRWNKYGNFTFKSAHN